RNDLLRADGRCGGEGGRRRRPHGEGARVDHRARRQRRPDRRAQQGERRLADEGLSPSAGASGCGAGDREGDRRARRVGGGEGSQGAARAGREGPAQDRRSEPAPRGADPAERLADDGAEGLMLGARYDWTTVTTRPIAARMLPTRTHSFSGPIFTTALPVLWTCQAISQPLDSLQAMAFWSCFTTCSKV